MVRVSLAYTAWLPVEKSTSIETVGVVAPIPVESQDETVPVLDVVAQPGTDSIEFLGIVPPQLFGL